MKTSSLVLIIICSVLLIIALVIINMVNSIRRASIKVEEASSDIDVSLTKRYDVLTKMIEVVKGYAKHEKDTFKEVVEARNKFATATDIKSKSEADNMLTSSLKSIFALSEAYPELKANENFLSLQTELSDIENKIASARRYFNAATREYNTLIKQFPANVLFHKQPKDYFEGLEEAKKAPKVKFD